VITLATRRLIGRSIVVRAAGYPGPQTSFATFGCAIRVGASGVSRTMKKFCAVMCRSTRSRIFSGVSAGTNLKSIDAFASVLIVLDASSSTWPPKMPRRLSRRKKNQLVERFAFAFDSTERELAFEIVVDVRQLPPEHRVPCRSAA